MSLGKSLLSQEMEDLMSMDTWRLKGDAIDRLIEKSREQSAPPYKITRSAFMAWVGGHADGSVECMPRCEWEWQSMLDLVDVIRENKWYLWKAEVVRPTYIFESVGAATVMRYGNKDSNRGVLCNAAGQKQLLGTGATLVIYEFRDLTTGEKAARVAVKPDRSTKMDATKHKGSGDRLSAQAKAEHRRNSAMKGTRHIFYKPPASRSVCDSIADLRLEPAALYPDACGWIIYKKKNGTKNATKIHALDAEGGVYLGRASDKWPDSIDAATVADHVDDRDASRQNR